MGHMPHDPRSPVSYVASTNLVPSWRQPMGIRSTFFAATYDRQIAKAERSAIGAWREDLLAGLEGSVLEIGGGTGLNLSHYGAGVDALAVTEPEPAMLRRLERRAVVEAPAATVLRAPAED